MQLAISNLSFTGFGDTELVKLVREHNYDLEIFYEFGTDYYWQQLLANLKGSGVKLSVHAPCVCVNLADPEDQDWFNVYKKTILFAKQYDAEFVVVHTNEGWQGERLRIQQLVEERLLQIVSFAQAQNILLLIENVGLISKDNLLYDFAEYQRLLALFPGCGALIDTGHAHINGWQLPVVLEVLAERVQALHLHDNCGSADSHECIGQGSICWHSCFAAVKQYTPQAKLVLEYGNIQVPELLRHLLELKCKYTL